MVLLDPQTSKGRRRRGTAPKSVLYRDRPFIAWDGEGWTDHTGKHQGWARLCKGGCPHYYCLFGASTGEFVKGPDLSTVDCLELILEVGDKYPLHIHVGFAFGYDCEMILKDLGWGHLRRLRKKTKCFWNGYVIERIPGKWLSIGRWNRETKEPIGKSVKILDSFSFFATSFVKALAKWNVGTKSQIEKIETGKDSRGDFRYHQLDDFIKPYWELELTLLVELMVKLRDNLTLTSPPIHPESWHGPGAVATSLFKMHKSKRALAQDLDDAVIEAGTYGYAGGRFETFRAGYFEGPVYGRDINSAYPAALSTMPEIDEDNWYYTEDQHEIQTNNERLGLYHMRFSLMGFPHYASQFRGFPLPAFHRSREGRISFPGSVERWFHASEYRSILRMYRAHPEWFDTFECVGAWIHYDNGNRPFSWVAELYADRLRWKNPENYNPAEKAAKLGLNSLYGKLAQRVGGKDGPPTWHQLQIAGAITADTRTACWEAALPVWRGLIAIETDGLYSTEPFSGLDEGAGLGQWEVTEYTGVLFLQNGVYWLRDMDGTWLPPKTRGIPSKKLDRESAYRALVEKRPLTAVTNQFIGYGLASMRHGRGWRTWERNTKSFVFGGNGKRNHIPHQCESCRNGMGLHEGLHTLTVHTPTTEISEPHTLPWLETQRFPEMQRVLEEIKWMIRDE